MNNKPATNLSLRDLVIRNPGFAVHPLEWIARHLELVDCKFQEIDAPPETRTPVHQEDTVKDVERLLRTYNWRSEAFIDFFVNERSPFEHMEGNPGFSFDGHRVLLADCEVFVLKSSASEETVIPTAPLVVAFLDYHTVIRAREQRFAPDHSWPHNAPLNNRNKRKLRLCTPKVWDRDPYLLCVMLALAQYNWELFESKRYPVRLVVYKSDDKKDAHVFHADFPMGILDQTVTPSTQTDDTWPIIYHTKINFESYGTFADRLTTHLLHVNFRTGAKENETDHGTVGPDVGTRTAAMA
ncbi:hypothetical protein FIE12Z_12134 [Fusarium flagelliforme]|uniref:Uncharacterized protein n=1 Tax=Fusarium flagelliforme TaxID=2675880 RepID=A0A395M6W7_9HYPO|nr:hypothetical protein FIE12Z_12134 [Fusarium flagelliforme]